MEKICKQCGKKFHLTSEDINFYQQKGWHLPERCEACRQQNRATKNKENNIALIYDDVKPIKKNLSACL